jgi:hypothetical protein
MINEAQVADGVNDVMENEEELLQYLNADGKKPTDKPADDPGTNDPADIAGAAGVDKGAGEGEDDEEKEKLTEYNNTIEYLNERYNLNLNVSTLPENLTQEQEAELIGELYGKVLQDSNLKLAEYQQIDNILKDKEVADFIAAKRDGKTMKDFVTLYAGSAVGKTDEEVVKDSLRKQFPTMSDTDIQESIDALKDRNKLAGMASTARERAITEEQEKKRSEEESQKQQAILDEQKRAEDVRVYAEYVGKLNTVYGVPVDETMKKQLILAATQTDEKGYTFLDKALQSDEGVLLATMGLLHLEKLIRASGTTNKNRVRNDLMSLLTSDPKELQSSSAVEQNDGNFNVNLANRF